MRFFAYLHQFKTSFRKIFYANKTFVATAEETKCAQELHADFHYNFQLKCKMATLEIQYMKNFTHWPLTEAKTRTEQNAIVYLDTSRKKRAIIKQKSHSDNKVLHVVDKAILVNKVVVIKKLR